MPKQSQTYLIALWNMPMAKVDNPWKISAAGLDNTSCRWQGNKTPKDGGRFMEGMISKSMRAIQYDFNYWEGTSMKPECWAQGLILKLMQTTHGQWI
jgi:hypothetical protein